MWQNLTNLIKVHLGDELLVLWPPGLLRFHVITSSPSSIITSSPLPSSSSSHRSNPFLRSSSLWWMMITTTTIMSRISLMVFYPSPITLHCFCVLWHICFALFIIFLSVWQYKGKRLIPWVKFTDILFTTLSNSTKNCTSRQCWYAACTYCSTPLPWSPTSSSWTTPRSTSTTSSASSTPTMPSFKRVSSTQEWSPTW